MPQQSHKLTAFGLIARQDLSVELRASASPGIKFLLAGSLIPASVDKVVSTQRNTVLAEGEQSICLVEHFMAAAALTRVYSLDLLLDSSELPFDDGSALFWLDALAAFSSPASKRYKLSQEIYIEDPSNPARNIRAIPATGFAVTYVLDLSHLQTPIGRMEYQWDASTMSVRDLASARTFASETENQILGLGGRVLGYTENCFTKELRHPLEPAQHKALDLLGDMYLSEINPLDIDMHVYSNQGGHSLNVEFARRLRFELLGY